MAAGVELMLLILKQKRVARAGALKALDFAITRSPANCERFVDQFGLKTIFAIFMGKAKVHSHPHFRGTNKHPCMHRHEPWNTLISNVIATHAMPTKAFAQRHS